LCERTALVVNQNLFKDNWAQSFAPTLFSQSEIVSSENNNLVNNKDGMNFTTGFSCFPITFEILYGGHSDETVDQTLIHFSTMSIISGRLFSFNLTLLDRFNNTLLFDNTSLSSIRKISEYADFLQIVRGFAQGAQGLHQYTDVRINTYPNTDFSVEVRIDIDERIFLPLALEQHSQNNISFIWRLHARPCIIGEILVQADSSCYQCAENEYSLIDPMLRQEKELCHPCPENAICEGGASIHPKAGFWRSSSNSSKIVKCLSPKFCLGAEGDGLSARESNEFIK
jgi:hypothetical protein